MSIMSHAFRSIADGAFLLTTRDTSISNDSSLQNLILSSNEVGRKLLLSNCNSCDATKNRETLLLFVIEVEVFVAVTVSFVVDNSLHNLFSCYCILSDIDLVGALHSTHVTSLVFTDISNVKKIGIDDWLLFCII